MSLLLKKCTVLCHHLSYKSNPTAEFLGVTSDNPLIFKGGQALPDQIVIVTGLIAVRFF